MSTAGGIVASGGGVEYETLPVLLDEDATYHPSRLLSSHARADTWVSIWRSNKQYG